MSNADNNQEHLPQPTAMDIQAIRSRLVNIGLVCAALVIPLPVILSLVRSFEQGWHPIVFFHFVVTGLIITGAVFRKRLSYHVRSFLLLGVFLLIGTMGLVGAGVLPMATFAVLTAALLGTRTGLAACLLVIGILSVIGAGVSTGAISFSFDINAYATSVTAWGIITAVFFLCIPLVVFVFGTMQKQLEASLKDSRDAHARHQRLADNLTGAFSIATTPIAFSAMSLRRLRRYWATHWKSSRITFPNI